MMKNVKSKNEARKNKIPKLERYERFKERVRMKEESKKLLSPKGAIVFSEHIRLTESRFLELKVVCSLSAGFCFLYDLLKRFLLNSCFSGKC
jgi:hypothetical protein